MSRKISVGFVVYNPEGSFTLRLQQLIALGFDVYVFDNSPWKSEVRNLSLTNHNIKYFTVGKNVGLGYGLSSVCSQAYYTGYSTLLFFDQDTIFSYETLDFIENYHLNNKSIENEFSAIAFSSKGGEEGSNLDCFREVSMIINSGSLFFLRNLKNLGWHNVNYFVDCVDYEFCLKSKIAGLKIGEWIRTPGFDHTSEQADKKYQVFGKQYLFRIYSSTRIKDTLKSSIKLIASAILSGQFNYAVKLIRHLLIYSVVQVVIRFMLPRQSEVRSINERRFRK
jgi:rhamnosyltransferase